MITKEMTIRQVLEKDINSAEIFLESGMHCVGCLPHPAKPSSRHAWCMGWMLIFSSLSSTSSLASKRCKKAAEHRGFFCCARL